MTIKNSSHVGGAGPCSLRVALLLRHTERTMKFNISKEWCEKSAKLEEGCASVGAGVPPTDRDLAGSDELIEQLNKIIAELTKQNNELSNEAATARNERDDLKKRLHLEEENRNQLAILGSENAKLKLLLTAAHEALVIPHVVAAYTRNHGHHDYRVLESGIRSAIQT